MKGNINIIGKFAVYAAIFCLRVIPLSGQKPSIEMATEKQWPVISSPIVSNNGQFVMYRIGNQQNMSLTVESTLSGSKRTIPRAGTAFFTQDNSKVIYKCNDSIGVVELMEDKLIQYIGGVSNFVLLKTGINTDVLLYQLKQMPGVLIAKDLGTGWQTKYTGVERYWVKAGSGIMVLETEKNEDSAKAHLLSWITIGRDNVGIVWEGRKVNNVIIDEEGNQCAFSVSDGDNDNSTTIWLYSLRDHQSKKIVDNRSFGIREGDHIRNVLAFNGRDKRIFLSIEEMIQTDTTASSFVPLDVWSYKDAQLQSGQLHLLHLGLRHSIYNAVTSTDDGKVIRLQNENEKLVSPLYSDKPMKYILGIKNGGGDLDDEWNWNPNAQVSVYLISLSDGKRIWVDSALSTEIVRNYVLSYNENYVFYYDAKVRDYYSYCISDGVRRKLGTSIHTNWINREWIDEPDSAFVPYPIAGLFRNEDAILVYDQNDIYEINPSRKTPLFNLTGSSRHGQDMEVRLEKTYSTQFVNRKDPMVFKTFDRLSKKQGLFRSEIDSLPYTRTFNLQSYKFGVGAMKARDAEIYFVQKSTASDYPNIFTTTDFKNYRPLTSVYPEKKYNWLKAELVTWKKSDGTTDQGILYMPEDFNPQKKYPLLVHYYERMSDNLYGFLRPGFSDGTLNIPFYVSHGYLVFTPDIHYKVGWPGRSAYDAVVSGVKYLSARKYIDTLRIGLQGHSFGGFETNYVIAHCHLFAAAMSASGMTDFVSAYGSIVGDGTSRQRQYELYRDRIGATLWEKPSLYLENSPVLRANKVTTPLLMMANKADDDVPWQQGIEFFTALRRLGKKAWMLQYDGQGHMVDGKAAEDFSLRMFQFFNYYLKGEPPPVWMTRGIPARLKGIETGLELDRSGEKP